MVRWFYKKSSCGSDAVEQKFFEISVIKSHVRMFSGHGNKSLHHCSVVQQGFGRTHRKVHPLQTCKSPGNVDRSEGKPTSFWNSLKRFLCLLSNNGETGSVTLNVGMATPAFHIHMKLF